MPTSIQVVLQEDVDKLGASGELVKVRPGFARNYLIPRSLAVVATTAQVNRINHERAVILAKYEKTKKETKVLADKLSQVKVKITRSVGDDDRLFGSVTSKDVHAALEALGHKVDRKKIVLADPIKALGEFDVPVRLMTDIVATIKVEVAKK